MVVGSSSRGGVGGGRLTTAAAATIQIEAVLMAIRGTMRRSFGVTASAAMKAMYAVWFTLVFGLLLRSMITGMIKLQSIRETRRISCLLMFQHYPARFNQNNANKMVKCFPEFYLHYLGSH